MKILSWELGFKKELIASLPKLALPKLVSGITKLLSVTGRVFGLKSSIIALYKDSLSDSYSEELLSELAAFFTLLLISFLSLLISYGDSSRTYVISLISGHFFGVMLTDPSDSFHILLLLLKFGDNS